MSTANDDTYPDWVWQFVDEFDRWAADRLPMVQDMILDAVGEQTLPKRTLKEALDIARSEGKTATVLWWATGLEERTRRRNPRSETGKARRKKTLAALQNNLPSCQKTLSTLWEEHFPGSKETDAPPWRLPDKVAFLARVHDVLIELDEGRKRRKRWERVAPEFKDVAQEIEFATLFQVESVARHDGDHRATGASQIEDCWQEVPDQVAAMEGATMAQAGSNEDDDTPPRTKYQKITNALVGDSGRKWTVKDLAAVAGCSEPHVKRCPNYKLWRKNQKTGRVPKGFVTDGGNLEAEDPDSPKRIMIRHR